MTVGEHFMSLDHAGQRAMMLGDVKFYAESPGPTLRMESRLFNVPVECVAAERRDDGQWRMLVTGGWRDVPAGLAPDSPMSDDLEDVQRS